MVPGLQGFQNFSKRQWLTLFVFAVADFCSAICVSLQAPFYPHGKFYSIDRVVPLRENLSYEVCEKFQKPKRKEPQLRNMASFLAFSSSPYSSFHPFWARISPGSEPRECST